MKNYVLTTIVLIAFCFGGWSIVQSEPQTEKIYEYKYKYNPKEKETNELAAQGWELVAIDSAGMGMGNVANYVFKREKK